MNAAREKWARRAAGFRLDVKGIGEKRAIERGRRFRRTGKLVRALVLAGDAR